MSDRSYSLSPGGGGGSMTGAQIKVAYEAEANTNAYTDAEKAKLAGVETAADVTDEANVKTAIEAQSLSTATLTGTESVLLRQSGTLKEVSAQNLAGLAIIVREYTSSSTWTKPSAASFRGIRILAIGGGGGGGSGRKGAASTARSGGGGGAGGAIVFSSLIPAAILENTINITVGAGGAGGTGQTADSTDGVDGAVGGDSYVDSEAFPWKASGGDFGNGGISSLGTGGTGISNAVYFTESGSTWAQLNGGAGNDGAASNGEAATSGNTGGAPIVPGGGGGGGGITSGNVPNIGGNGSVWWNTNIPLYGAPSETNGGAINTVGGTGSTIPGFYCGTGGGGAGGCDSNASAGGYGGDYGGGGGGGSNGIDATFDSGAGGDGGDGIVVIYEYY